jgi:hypothetical protein
MSGRDLFTTASTYKRHLPNVKHEARLTEGARSMQDTCLNCGESFGLGAGQPLLSMRLFCVVWYTYIQGVAV